MISANNIDSTWEKNDTPMELLVRQISALCSSNIKQWRTLLNVAETLFSLLDDAYESITACHQQSYFSLIAVLRLL